MRHLLLASALAAFSIATLAEEIGSVSTKFKWMGPNDKIVIEAFHDEDVPGVVCYLSRAKTGGVSGAIGVAEDTSDASIECTQIGPIQLPDDVRSGKRNGDEVFKKRTSLVFKSLQVVRFYDAPRNALVYLSYSDRVIEGSPKNSVSAVAIRPWAQAATTQAGPAGN
ncbi:CreA family protein [Thiorhodococcus minor]|uniref:Protein CreA n=1 Tax=Thiorhodococcus minor TaxID=57489 RepID=A0A6M0K4S4_9GAMM|nr:CreA family protein [Thiorhodococcus minor]NEV64274.1 protein CreA [Thiorhodococcus minor]